MELNKLQREPCCAALTQSEAKRFATLCRRQDADPAAVLRRLVQMYIKRDGDLQESPMDLDRTLDAFLDWRMDGFRPSSADANLRPVVKPITTRPRLRPAGA
jgi:hypothetical protein